MLGAKIDLSKCFDRCNAELSIHILGKLGCDARVLRLVEMLYCDLRVYFSKGGLVTQHAAKRTNGVLQGCPFSMLLMAATMAAWCHHIRNSTAGMVDARVFVDDRLFWTNSEEALLEAVRSTSQFDADFGFMWNPGKGQIFKRKPVTNPQVLELEAQVGPLANEVKMLGITIDVAAANSLELSMGLREEAYQDALRLIKRIDLAAITWAQRAVHCNALIIPKVKWGAQWQRVDDQDINKMELQVERLLTTKTMYGRST